MSNNNDEIKGFSEKSIVENKLDNIFSNQNPQKTIQFGDASPVNLNNDWIVVSANGMSGGSPGVGANNWSKAQKQKNTSYSSNKVTTKPTYTSSSQSGNYKTSSQSGNFKSNTNSSGSSNKVTTNSTSTSSSQSGNYKSSPQSGNFKSNTNSSGSSNKVTTNSTSTSSSQSGNYKSSPQSGNFKDNTNSSDNSNKITTNSTSTSSSQSGNYKSSPQSGNFKDNTNSGGGTDASGTTGTGNTTTSGGSTGTGSITTSGSSTNTGSTSTPGSSTNTGSTSTPESSTGAGITTMPGAPTGTGTIYWFASYRIGEIENTITTILLTYKMIRAKCVNLTEKIKEYVNVGGKWNDANSKIFAQWWNGGMIGSLVSKPNEGLQIESSGNSYSIKEILNRCANLYWVAICRQLYYVVNMKYPQQLNNMGNSAKSSYFKGADESYATVPIDSENAWINLMAELTRDGEFNWSLMNLPVENASNGGSSTSELEVFIEIISKEINSLKASLDNFITYIGFIITDTPRDGNYFGFTPNPNITEAAKFFENEKEQFIVAFETNLKNALSMYDESVTNKMSEYLSTKYNLN